MSPSTKLGNVPSGDRAGATIHRRSSRHLVDSGALAARGQRRLCLLSGSDDEEEDAEAERIKAERVAAYNVKKAAKPKTIAKSVVTFEVKPWDDETDMVKLEEAVRAIEMEGLVWGASKLVPIGYGIRKLQVTLVVEDELVSLEDLQDKVAELEDYVQSSDVVAMQKL
ncbi:hypothetical protein EVJ58_g2541 [Rhodofomes roseus]|uniref:Translation elongation factor EF1B beta/delta subunit guanine nucleotide exchange domain-containing protein n=1 Tax=Rhodofomes roseus TaxID=34475 RepID=A0A4Y9YPU3_9APHY|nr:hypothetical protein EVJ58_g2541 [Rhodofomes roseus]